MPPDVLAARAEAQVQCGSGEVQVSVPSGFAGSMDSVGVALASVCPEETVLEVAAGEPAPVALVDKTPSQADIDQFKTSNCPSDPVIVVPAFGYPVTMAYNVVGLEGLVMTPEIVAGILSGQVTSWEDPLLLAENPDFDLTLLPDITLMSVDSPQGDVEAMTTWVGKQDQKAWPQGMVGTLDAGQKFATQADLLAEMAAVEGSIAVLPVSVAFNNILATANLPVKGTDANGQDVDTVITADDVQLYKIGSGATVVTKDAAGNLFASPATGGFPIEGNFDIASSKIMMAEGAPLVGWPVLGYAHLLICDNPAEPLPLLFAQYLVRLAGQGSLESYGLTPMPEPIRIQTFAPLKVVVNVDGEAAPSATPVAS
jgi:phosphate transport system substrate-binding protein